MVAQTISITVAACSLLIALLTFVFSRNSDSKNSTAAFTEVSVKLSFISSQLTDLQAELKKNEDELTRLRAEMDEKISNVQITAEHALDRANAAHNRLDRSHIDSVGE